MNYASFEWFLIFYNLQLCLGYTNFSSDFIVLKTALSPVLQDYADKLLYISQDMPWPCRNDICYATKSSDDRKGNIYWPEITTSHKVELRCPFSFEVPVYTTRVCGLSMNGTAEWEKADFEIVCPDPPLAELLKAINNEVYEAKYIYNFNATSLRNMYAGMLIRVIDVFTRYRDTPIGFEDVANLMVRYFEALTYFTEPTHESMPWIVADNFFSILDTLMDDDLIHLLSGQMFSFKNQFPMIVEKLPYKIEKEENETLSFIFSNIVMYVINIDQDTPDRVNISNVFTTWSLSNNTVYTPNVSLDLTNVDRTTGRRFDVAMTIFKKATLLHDLYRFRKLPPPQIEDMPQYDHTPPDFPPFPPQGQGTPQYDNIPPNFPPFPPLTMENGTMEYSDEDYDEPSLPPQDFIENVEHFEEVGSIIYLTSSLQEEDYNFGLFFEMYDSCNDSMQTEFCLGNRSCVQTNRYSGHTSWDNLYCSMTNDNSTEDGYTSCLCSGLATYGVFAKVDAKPPAPLIPPLPPIVTVKPGDISAFLGFEYQKGIEILGNVLCCISLAGLVVTVASYALFRRARKGAPTTVLLNLCAALICLSSMLLAIYFATDIMTITGCTVTNTLRYYLVFVTLVWNGIEAFNMYMMLVRVFNSDISKFGIKAGVIAWGLPLVMVAICFAVSKKSFDGEHVLISAELGQCIFRCQLRNNTLYYGFIIPMGVIIAHNFIMFGFVLNAILKHGNQMGKSKKKNRLVQLIGAVATLVLLGVPWMFSAFGAIDVKENDDLRVTKVVFQVIFVILVNLQGLFIFIFHCARNVQVRQSWSGAFSGTLSTGATQIISNNSNVKSQSAKPENIVTVTKKNDEFHNI